MATWELLSTLSDEDRRRVNDPLDEAVALHEEAEALHDDGLYDDALDAARRSLFLFERHSGRDHPDAANVLLLVGAVHEDRSEYAEATAVFERADAILDRFADHAEPILVRLRVKARCRLGSIRRVNGDLAAADRILRDAVELAEMGLGPDDPAAAGTTRPSTTTPPPWASRSGCWARTTPTRP